MPIEVGMSMPQRASYFRTRLPGRNGAPELPSTRPVDPAKDAFWPYSIRQIATSRHSGFIGSIASEHTDSTLTLACRMTDGTESVKSDLD